MRRADVGVAEPQSDDGGVDARLQQGHGAAVAEDVGVEPLGSDRGAVGRRGGGVLAHEPLYGVTAEPTTGACRKQRLVATAGALGHPDPEDGLGGGGQRDGAVAATLASQGMLAPVPRLTSPQSGAVSSDTRRPVCMARRIIGRSRRPSHLDRVRSGEERLDLRRNEEGHEGLSNRLAGMARLRWMSAACSG